MDNKSIKTNIFNFRKKKRMTQGQVAEMLGISPTAYRELEKGDTTIVNPKIVKMAEILDTSTEELVLGYLPSQTQDKKVEDLRQEYGVRVESLQNKIEQLEKLVQSQAETIESKNEIIIMLKKMLGEQK